MCVNHQENPNCECSSSRYVMNSIPYGETFTRYILTYDNQLPLLKNNLWISLQPYLQDLKLNTHKVR